MTRNCVCQLYEYSQRKQWPKPKDSLVKETGAAHDKHYVMRYSIATRLFPTGAGKSKDLAKRRAAARALSVLQESKTRGNYKHGVLLLKRLNDSLLLSSYLSLIQGAFTLITFRELFLLSVISFVLLCVQCTVIFTSSWKRFRCFDSWEH